ncbi:hypothetical protein [Bradyrhizobium sp. dw_78]|uniref:hypothetical protein n=1 Tax=Bradyrhizobium sp. dw_78 TaxID=2719793 RepID=UPI001BD6CE40|nr:hypothetical protein [Bradyrhizobium sp. dw_78]
MFYRTKALAAVALALAPLATLASMGSAAAADLPVKVKAKPVADVPFFFVNDNRFTYSYQFTATDPGAFSVKPNGSLDGHTAKQVYSFTHFDVWAYGTNFINLDLLKSDHNDPASPCTNVGATIVGDSETCAGAAEFYGLIRSTFGWNQLFSTNQFTMGPLHNISFEVGADGETENSFLAPNKKDIVAGLQFAFDLPYKGYIDIAPLYYQEWNHNAFLAPGLVGSGCLTPTGACTGIADGNTRFDATWALEINYYMDLGFLPENMQYFAISGRAGFYGPKGGGAPIGTAIQASNATKTEINSEPIRLTFDMGKAIWGAKYSHEVDTWVAYRYWENKFGLDDSEKSQNPVCYTNGANNHSCTEKSVSAGVTVKF